MTESEATSSRARKTSVGGQALLEGLMMIGPRKAAIAVRKPDGEIELKIQELKKKTKAQQIPVVRDAANMVRQLALGFRALMYSAEFFDLEEDSDDKEVEDKQVEDKEVNYNDADALGESAEERKKSARGAAKKEPEKPSKFDQFLEKRFGDKAKDVIVYIAVALSICMTVGLFILLPNFLAGFLPLNRDNAVGLFVHNLFEGAIRIDVFVGYLALSSRMKEIQRVWRYHGAEHKTIHCYEHGDELTVDNIRKYPTKHPRCGTSFLFLVMAVSILVFSVIDIALGGVIAQYNGFIRRAISMGVRLVMIPLVAGVAFEAIKFAGRSDNLFTKIISAPGLFFQTFTTKEPDDSMMEVAIAAFENAMSDDDREMTW